MPPGSRNPGGGDFAVIFVMEKRELLAKKSVSDVSFVGYFLSSDKCQATSLRTYFQDLIKGDVEDVKNFVSSPI